MLVKEWFPTVSASLTHVIADGSGYGRNGSCIEGKAACERSTRESKASETCGLTVIPAFLLLLMFALGGVSSADAHSQYTCMSSPEAAVSLTPHDACCHGDSGELAMTTFAASTC
jgi:hypothetical protein